MNFSDCQKYNKLRIISILMILLVLTMPFSYAEEIKGTVDETVEQPQERSIGEDILINVDEYQPNIIRSSLLSKQNINVYALLRGTPINPSIKIARIKSIDAKIVNITTKPEGKKLNIASPTYRAPKREEISYDNMGYMVIPLSKMNEDEMPNEIKLSVNARILFDISGTLLYSEYTDALLEQSENDWSKEMTQHQFFGGYVRADEIKDDKASFVFYDIDKNKISSFSLKPGEIKSVNSYARLDRTLSGSGYSGLFDNFRIKLDSITGIGINARLLIFTKDNQIRDVTVRKGDSLYDGSEWYVYDIVEKSKKDNENNYEVAQIILKTKKGLNLPLEKILRKIPIVKEGVKETVKVEEKVESISSNSLTQDQISNYQKAISAYEKLLNYEGSNEDIKNKKIEAMENIARIYGTIGDYTNSLAYYKKLFDSTTDLVKRGTYSARISNMESNLKSTTETISATDNGEQISIQLREVNTITEQDKPKADLRIENGIITKYGEGEALIGGWSISSITDRNKIIIKKIVEGKEVTDNLELNREKIINDENGVKHNVLLTNIDLKLEARITITPQVEGAMTEANFNLRLTIEKRPKLEDFVGNLDNTINKTEKLIKKLDNIIKNTEKIQNIWTKSCYVTFGTLWVKNLVTGFLGSAGVARKKISGEWHDKYKRSGEKISYDQYVINHKGEYNADLKNAETILQDIKEGKHKTAFGSEFDGVSNDRKADAYWERGMFKDNPEDTWSAYISSELELRKEAIYDDMEKIKTPEGLGDYKGDVEAITGTLDQTKFDNDKERIVQVYYWLRSKNEKTDFFTEFQGKDEYTKMDGTTKKSVDQAITNLQIQPDQNAVITEVNKRDLFYNEATKKYTYLNLDTGLKIGDVQVQPDKFLVIFPAGEKATGSGINAKITDTTATSFQHNPLLTQIKEGRSKGKVEMISLDAMYYAQVEDYFASGLSNKISVWRRRIANEPLGTGNLVGELNEVIRNLENKRKENSISEEEKQLLKELNSLSNQIQNCNRKLEFKTWGVGVGVGAGCESYKVTEKAPEVIGPQCTDFMTPTDCGILFNACDPVICPASRCNLAGRWTVKNVVETGIVGSTVLCLPNFGPPPDKVLVPICITGILAGLKNIQSILKGFNECLKSAKVDGKSLGICDRIRNVGICEILWREAIAIFNIKGGLLGFITDKIAGKAEGGAEYSNFKQSLDNSVGAVSYFTQSYAKNIFAAYSGKGFGEIGTEICKSAIYGNVPGIGDFFEQALKPESPPQFFAFFDEAPYQDVLEKQESIYTVFYHIYAGENEDIIYSVYIQNVDETGKPITSFGRVYLVPNRRLDAGQFADENLEKVFFSGYNQICVETSTSLKGKNTVCGFGKVTTDFGINWLNDAYTAQEASKKINTKEQCVSETGRVTNIEYAGGTQFTGSSLTVIPEAAVGAVSTGLTQTGIVRTCSAYDPDVGTGKDEWKPVGSCGTDELGRNLGQCWLYAPALSGLIKDTTREATVNQNLKNTAEELNKEIPGMVNCKYSDLISAIQSATYSNKIEEIKNKLTGCGLSNEENANIWFEIGKFYERVAVGIIKGQIIVSPENLLKQKGFIKEPEKLEPVQVEVEIIPLSEEVKDKTAPTTTIKVEGTKGNNDWYTSDVTVTLTCEDKDNQGNVVSNGCDKTYYSKRGEDIASIYTNPIIISDEGSIEFFYYSIDKIGNRESYNGFDRLITMKIDKTKPGIMVDKISSNVGSIAIEFVVVDKFLSEAKCDFRLSSTSDWIPSLDTKLDTNTKVQTDGYYKDTCVVSSVGTGSYDIKISVTDQAGWSEEKIIEKVSLL